MSKYNELALEIIEKVGGKENIKGLTHCMTRLRFDLKNYDKVDEDALRANSFVISTTHAGGKFQVIIGNAVSDVYQEITNYLGGFQDASKETKKEKTGIVTTFTNTITKIITPTLGVLVATGLLKGLLAIITAMNLLDANSGTFIILNALSDALFYFFPVILGYTSAEAFGLNKFIGMILGATLIYPGIMENMLGGDVVFQLLPDTPFTANAYATFLGIPIVFPTAGYASTVIPIILITYLGAKIEKFFKKVIPDIIGFAFTPFLTLLITAPLAFILIGPIANIISSFIGWITTTMYGISPILAAVVVALIYQPLVIFGLHWPLITLAITNFTSQGYDFIWPMMFTASFAQTAVVLAVGLKTTNEQTKAMTGPSIISGLMCIIEPAIYGFSLPDKKRFLFSSIGAAVGSVIITIFNANQYTLGIGLLGFSGFISPKGDIRNMMIAMVATAITMVITFVLTYVTFKEVDNGNGSGKSKSMASDKSISIDSPISGMQVDLKKIDDSTFESEVLGKTIAINPIEGIVRAPFDGVVETFLPTGHVVGIIGFEGQSILIHVGVGNEEIDATFFKKCVKQGDSVEKGEVLLEFDIKELDKAGYSACTTITLTNSRDYIDVIKTDTNNINYASEIMRGIS